MLAAAHDTADAEFLAAERLDHDGGASGVLPMRDLLAAEYWGTSADHFIADPFLRTLLLHRLHTDRVRWRDVQQAMSDHYPDGHPRRIHHELALGQTAFAVSRLRDTFRTSDAGAWLRELRFIASAPLFDTADERRAVALGRTDAEQSVPDGTDRVFHLRIRRLLYSVWQLTDLLALPDDDVTDKMGDELQQLSALHPTGNEELWQASRSWPQAVREWRTLPTTGD